MPRSLTLVRFSERLIDSFPSVVSSSIRASLLEKKNCPRTHKETRVAKYTNINLARQLFSLLRHESRSFLERCCANTSAFSHISHITLARWPFLAVHRDCDGRTARISPVEECLACRAVQRTRSFDRASSENSGKHNPEMVPGRITPVRNNPDRTIRSTHRSDFAIEQLFHA